MFRAKVKELINKRQYKRFIQGRRKYKNDPTKIDYKKEILEELDDVVIYRAMWEVMLNK